MTNEKYDMKQLQKDCKALGVINIEAADDLTPAYVFDAVRAVKEINLDMASVAKEMEEKRRNPRR
ncbi:MAG: hypothetical protein IJP62_03385 [Treponema sp.]|nr:hypothetical protein [Treponema sp.]MBQ6780258.1 hypothetical protein [Treponema sp.]